MTTKAREYIKGIGDAVADRTINRIKEDGTRETWADVAKRVSEGNVSLLENTVLENTTNDEFEAMHHHLRQASLLLSGRHLQHGDAGQNKRNIEVFTNCSTSATSFLLFYLLLNGSGVGRSYDNIMSLVDWGKLPIVVPVIDWNHKDVMSGEIISIDKRTALHFYQGKEIIEFEVPDSREGWAQAIEFMEVLAYEGIHRDKALILDFSAVRPRNSPIKGMQDRPASGPGPLMVAIKNVATLREAGMEPWRAAMYADHYLAECVLVGGARRAARMATKNWRDKNVLAFIEVKRGGFLWSANNSVTSDAKFWRYTNKVNDIKKLNPALTIDELVERALISELEAHAYKVFERVCECSYHDGTGEPGFINQDKMQFDPSGIEEILKGDYAESEKYKLLGSSKQLMKDLAKAFTLSPYKLITNPCVTADTLVNTFYGEKSVKELINTPFMASVLGESFQSKKGFWSTGIKPTLKITLENDNVLTCTYDHEILEDFGHGNQHYTEAQNLLPGISRLVTRNGAVYVKSIVKSGDQEVYDCTVETKHQFEANSVIVANCGEIQLIMLGGYCVIADVVPYFAQNDDDAEDAFRVATRALIRTNLMDALYGKEVIRTNRIGVGFTGIHEYAWSRFGYGWKDLVNEDESLPFWLMLSRFKRAVQEEAETYSRKLGVAIPHTDTTVKPAGTTSKLFGLTEGAHLPSMREYLRWVQFRSDDPLVQINKDKGYPVKELRTYSGTTIVGFPTRPEICSLGMGDKLVTAAEASPEEQYNYLRLIEKYWITGVDDEGDALPYDTGNQVSYTLKYNPAIVTYEMFRQTLLEGQASIRACSVMPQTDTTAYEYVPEQSLSKHEYEQIANAIKQDNIKEDIGFEHVDCSSGACPIDFNRT